MKNALVLVVLFAVAASAAPAPGARELKVTPLTETPQYGYVSPDGEWSAVNGENAITVWSIREGKPKFRIDRPEVPSGSGDGFDFAPGEFSPDGRYLIARLIQYKRDSQGMSIASIATAMLVSIAEERIVRTLYTLEGPCVDYGGISKDCAEITGAYFSPDARKAVISARRFLSGDRKGDYRNEQITAAFALDGTKVFEESQKSRNFKGDRPSEADPVNRRYAEFAGFDLDGRMLGIAADADSCALKDGTSGKRIAFLDGCTAKDNPGLHHASGSIISDGDAFFKVWGLDGALRAKLSNAGSAPYELKGWTLTRDGRYALNYRAKTYSSDSGELALWDVKTGERVAVSSAPEFASGYTILLPPDRGHLIYSYNSKLHYAKLDTGGPLVPEEKRFIARVDEADLAAAPAPAAAPPPSAPAANFDLPPAAATPADPDAYAVVIGIEKYRQAAIPAVDYAARDAKTMYDYLTGAMGYDPKNVLLMTNEQATKTDLEKNLGSWLKNRVGAGSRVFVYYAGHGAPNPATGEGYLMPYEADASYLEDTAYPVAKLYASLAKLPTKRVTVVLDACFSGQGGRSLIAKGARPLVPVVQAKPAPNAVVLAAAAANQISASDPERRHGLLSSRLFQALHGAGDADGDGRLTTAEIFEFVLPAVERAARLQNLEQTPMISPSLAAVKAAPGAPWIVFAKKEAKP